jgi:hypothetical protein
MRRPNAAQMAYPCAALSCSVFPSSSRLSVVVKQSSTQYAKVEYDVARERPRDFASFLRASGRKEAL